jgi:hypothetical protein
MFSWSSKLFKFDCSNEYIVIAIVSQMIEGINCSLTLNNDAIVVLTMLRNILFKILIYYCTVVLILIKQLN